MSDEQGSGAPNPAEDEVFSAREAANFLGISERRLHRLRRRGEIAALRVGWRRYCFRASELMTYVERVADRMTPVTPASPSDVVPAAMEPVAVPTAEEEAPVEDAPIVRLANAILVNALEADGTHIHLEPQRRDLRVRVRIDGELRELMTLPKHVARPLFQRYKVMADLELPFTAGGRVAQSGFIGIRYRNVDINFRASTCPTPFGDSIVFHVYDGRQFRQAFGSLGMSPEVEGAWRGLALSRSGLLLLAGAHGAGRTTTAYATLNLLNHIERKIFTAEETRGYDLSGAAQVYPDAARGVTTEAAVRNVLRQDPDILYLSDISRPERARCAVEAAEAGVLVLATLPAMDAVSALQRLTTGCGITPSRAAAVVTGVLAQELMRVVCPDCAEEHTANTGELGRRFPARSLPVPGEVALRRGRGCPACRDTGFRRRVGVFELLRPGEALWARLSGGDVLPTALREAARSEFVATLGGEAARKVVAGVTTPEEASRCLGSRLGR